MTEKSGKARAGVFARGGMSDTPISVSADTQASSPESDEADGNSTCKRPRTVHYDEPVTFADSAMAAAGATLGNTGAEAEAACSRMNLDDLASRLEKEEESQNTARREAASAAAAAAAAASAAAAATAAATVAAAANVEATAPLAGGPGIFDGESFAMLDFSMVDEGSSASKMVPPADAPNKKLDLGLVAKHLEASLPSVERVAGRKVALLLGNTGVGKSLLLQALAGRNVVQRRYAHSACAAPPEAADPDAMDVSDPEPPAGSLEERWVWDVEEPLEGFGVGHEQASETKCIRHYTRAEDASCL